MAEVRNRKYRQLSIAQEFTHENNVISFVLRAEDVADHTELRVTYRPILDDAIQSRIFETIRVKILQSQT